MLKVCTMTTTIKETFIFLLLTLCIEISYGQADLKVIKAGGFELKVTTVDPELNTFFCLVGELPDFPGGKDSLFSFAKKNLYYPETAKTDSIQGKVMLQFTVDSSGKVIDERVKIGVRTDLDTLCLSMLKKMPIWKTARLEGRAIAVQFLWPIKFTLTKKEDD